MTNEYHVVLSNRVSAGIRALVQKATASGRRLRVLESLKLIDKMLRFYPQFGEPLQDPVQGGKRCIATIAPLFVEYSLSEATRTVFVVKPLVDLESE